MRAAPFGFIGSIVQRRDGSVVASHPPRIFGAPPEKPMAKRMSLNWFGVLSFAVPSGLMPST